MALEAAQTAILEPSWLFLDTPTPASGHLNAEEGLNKTALAMKPDKKTPYELLSPLTLVPFLKSEFCCVRSDHNAAPKKKKKSILPKRHKKSPT